MFSKLALLGTIAMVDGASWNYEKNGADWPELTIEDNECGNAAQSPINLFSPGSADFDYKVYQADKDTFTKDYSN